MSAKHTPGPWHVGVKQAERIVYDSTGWAVANATVYHGESDTAEVLANARLIAAAPDLLAALEDLRASVQKWAPTIDQSRARAAIAKAKGE